MSDTGERIARRLRRALDPAGGRAMRGFEAALDDIMFKHHPHGFDPELDAQFDGEDEPDDL